MEKKHLGITKFLLVTILIFVIGIVGDDETRKKIADKINKLTAR